MSDKQKYQNKVIPALYRKQILDVMIFTFIQAQRRLIPTLTIRECGISFLKHYDIDEDELSLLKIEKTYQRIQKEVIKDERTQED